MQPVSFEPVRYRLCWVREVAPGQIQSDLGLEVDPEQLLPALAGLRPHDKPITGLALLTSYGLQDAFRSYEIFSCLPVWCRRRLSVMFGEIVSPEELAAARRNLGRLVELTETVARAAPYAGPVEVHLPYLDFDAWNSRFELLRDVRFGYHCGRMFPFATASNPVAATAWQALLAASTTYGSERAFTIAGWDRSVPGYACGSWRAIPPDNHARYFSVMCGMTTGVQRALRRYIGNCCIRREMHTLGDPSRSWPLLAYVYSTPFPGRRPRHFVRDFNHPMWIMDLLSTARMPLRAAIKKFQSYFFEIGRRDLSRFYARVRAKQIVDWARNERTTLAGILSLEAALTNRFVEWGTLITHSTSPSEIESASRSLAHDLDGIVRGLPISDGVSQLPSLLLTEATCGLNWAMGGRHKMSRLRISKQQIDSASDFAGSDEIQLPGDDYCHPISAGRPHACV
jgi:hypothetical protein